MPPAPQAGFAQPGYQQPGYQPGYQQPAYQPGYGPPPGGFTPPAPPSFATPPPPSQHRLSGKIIAAIVAGVVIVAAGVGAAFAFSGGSGKTAAPAVSTSPAPKPSPTSHAPSSQPTTQPSSQPTTSAPPSSPPTTSAPPSPQPAPSHTGGGAITVAGPVAVTPAPGWSTIKHGSNYVVLGGKGTILLVTVGRGQTRDVTQNLIDDIENFTKGTTGLRLGQAAPASRINGRNFNELRDVAFQYSVTTQQGTVTVHGLFVEFLNTSNGLSAFCVYSGQSTSALQANLHDALGMIASIE
jgi:hypothetical protein